MAIDQKNRKVSRSQPYNIEYSTRTGSWHPLDPNPVGCGAGDCIASGPTLCAGKSQLCHSSHYAHFHHTWFSLSTVLTWSAFQCSLFLPPLSIPPNYTPSQTSSRYTMAAAVVQIPSHNRVEPGSSQLVPAAYPESHAPPETDVHKITSEWAKSLNEALASQNFDSLKQLFLPGSCWRDRTYFSEHFLCNVGREEQNIFLGTRRE